MKIKKDEKGRIGGERKEISQVFSDDRCAKKAIFHRPLTAKRRKKEMSNVIRWNCFI